MNERTKRRGTSNDAAPYIRVDAHEKESQLAVFEKGGSLLTEERLPTKELGKSRSRCLEIRKESRRESDRGSRLGGREEKICNQTPVAKAAH
jgi:hypothetical protein